MNVPLFIGNLDFETSAENLEEKLSPFGKIISLEIIKDRFTSRSKGYAYALVEDKQTADLIIESLNGQIIDGRLIRIEFFKS